MTAAVAAQRLGHRWWRRPSRRTAGLLLAGAAVAGYLAWRGTGVLPHRADATAFTLFNDARREIDGMRDSSPVFLFVVNYLRFAVGQLVSSVQALLAGLGWAGVTGVAAAIAAVAAGWRIAALTAAGFCGFGLLGLWPQAMDTLALTVSAVLLSVAVGVPLGIAAGRIGWLRAGLSPVLDVMQIMPTFAYLAPLTLFFLIGAPSATIATMIYAMPPVIRITALGIRQASTSAVEAATAMGSTGWQVLRKVQLPMARQSILLGINQTIMMALSMVVVTALIDAPGLGVAILRSLERARVGPAFEAGLAIVIMAIVLDRVTAHAARRAEVTTRPATRRSRRLMLAGAAAVAATGVVVGTAVPAGGAFPAGWRLPLAAPVDRAVRWAELTWYPVTDALRNLVTEGLLNPLQTVLTSAPWWLVVGVTFLAGLLVSGVRSALVAAAALGGIAALGLWQHAMQTLSLVTVATLVTMAFGLVFGVLAARHDRFATALRPLLDAAQTMPPFVYLLPAVALFGPTRFTAIAAVVIFAVPAVIRLVERALREVPATVLEAAVSAGSTRAQVLWKVQLPIARPGLLLAANQGIVMVLAMVVVAGLVGAGGLGYDVVAGFSQRSDFGKGLAAGIAIVLLGIMLDRLSQGAGRQRRPATG